MNSRESNTNNNKTFNNSRFVVCNVDIRKFSIQQSKWLIAIIISI